MFIKKYAQLLQACQSSHYESHMMKTQYPQNFKVAITVVFHLQVGSFRTYQLWPLNWITCLIQLPSRTSQILPSSFIHIITWPAFATSCCSSSAHKILDGWQQLIIEFRASYCSLLNSPFKVIINHILPADYIVWACFIFFSLVFMLEFCIVRLVSYFIPFAASCYKSV